jgi:hypothetical protein
MGAVMQWRLDNMEDDNVIPGTNDFLDDVVKVDCQDIRSNEIIGPENNPPYNAKQVIS